MRMPNAHLRQAEGGRKVPLYEFLRDFAENFFLVGNVEEFRNASGEPCADRSAVNFRDRKNFGERIGEEYFVRIHELLTGDHLLYHF